MRKAGTQKCINCIVPDVYVDHKTSWDPEGYTCRHYAVHFVYCIVPDVCVDQKTSWDPEGYTCRHYAVHFV